MALSAVALVVMAFGVVHAQAPSMYVPTITSEPLEGKITSSTFVLDQPRCVFNNVVGDTDLVWLVVAHSSAEDKVSKTPSPAQLPYQEFKKNSAYMTLSTAVTNYPCPEAGQENNAISVLRVGNETGCISDVSRPDCNGPLPGPGPYSVKFVAMNSNVVTAESKWSEPITLIQGKNPNTIDTEPRQRSASMIAITSILSILFAILLAALIAALIYKYSNICDGADIKRVQDSATMTRYTTHHIYDQPAHKL
ncbi:uroplakin-3b-like [Elgaria multicarinata webbii]|uniref:uroplakin-3b-like n=1 Tax=Elgaria multicarinata webbii TaxID=159646 RepID=UPI002FCD05DA